MLLIYKKIKYLTLICLKMKTKIVSLLGMFLIGTMTLFAVTKTEKIKVNGNCDMCKAKIEKAAKAVNGVSKVEWNKDTKVLTVEFDADKTAVQNVENAIASVGYDTQSKKASDAAYAKLPGCCKYDRAALNAPVKEKSKDNHEGHSHT